MQHWTVFSDGLDSSRGTELAISMESTFPTIEKVMRVKVKANELPLKNVSIPKAKPNRWWAPLDTHLTTDFSKFHVFPLLMPGVVYMDELGRKSLNFDTVTPNQVVPSHKGLCVGFSYHGWFDSTSVKMCLAKQCIDKCLKVKKCNCLALAKVTELER